MSRGAKITLVVFVVLLVVAGLSVTAWFLFKNERATAAESYLAKGDKFLNEKNYSQALIAYKKAALLTPRSFAPYFKQGLLAKETLNYQEAIDFVNRSVNLAPNEAEIYLALGEIYLSVNDTANANDTFKEAQRILPSSDEVNFMLFEVALKNGDLSEAQRNLEAAEKNSDLSKYKIYNALLESFNDPTKSLEITAEVDQPVDLGGLNLADFSNLFQKLIKTENIDSRKVMIYQVFSQIGEVDFGTKGLEEISKNNPEMRDAWVFLAYSYLLDNQPEKAKSAIDKATTLDPVFPATYYLLSKYYEVKGDTKQAEKSLEHAQELGFDENNPLKS